MCISIQLPVAARRELLLLMMKIIFLNKSSHQLFLVSTIICAYPMSGLVVGCRINEVSLSP